MMAALTPTAGKTAKETEATTVAAETTIDLNDEES